MEIEGIFHLMLRREGLELVHGAVWLPAQGVADFVRGDKFRRGHSLANIKRSLIGADPPPGTNYPNTMKGIRRIRRDVYPQCLDFESRSPRRQSGRIKPDGSQGWPP